MMVGGRRGLARDAQRNAAGVPKRWLGYVVVYALVGRSGWPPFYIGMTIDPAARLVSHRMYRWKFRVKKFSMVEIAYFRSHAAAREFETLLITTLPGLDNLTLHRAGCRCRIHRNRPKYRGQGVHHEPAQ